MKHLKIDRQIEYCLQCPFLNYSLSFSYCNNADIDHNNSKIEDRYKILKNCPLPNINNEYKNQQENLQD